MRKAQHKARVELARILSNLDLHNEMFLMDEELESDERSEWEAFSRNTSEESFRVRLKAGIAIIGSQTLDDRVFATAATTPDLSNLSSSINRQAK